MARQSTPSGHYQNILSRRMAALESLAVGVVFSTLYLLTIAGSHADAEDSLWYLRNIRSGNASDLFHPHHLVYEWCGWAVYHAALGLGYSGGPMLPVQVFNALTGALGIAVLWALLRRVVGRVAAASGCGLLGFFYGYWWYSVEAEVYILSTLLLICSLTVAYHAAMDPRWKLFALLGGAQGFAILAHQTNVLFAIVAAGALFIASRSLPLGDVIRCALAYAGAGIAIVVPPYVSAIAILRLRTLGDVYYWLTRYAQADVGGSWELLNIPKAVFGFGRALVGGHFLFALEPSRKLLLESFPSQSLREEQFLVRNFPDWLILLLLALSAVVIVALIVAVLGWLRQPKLDSPQARVLAILCITWFVPYALFFLWWEPQNLEFWIAPLVPVVILFALLSSVHEYRSRRRFLSTSVMILLSALISVNFLGSVWPQHNPKNDYWRMRTSWYEGHTSSSDLVLYGDSPQGRYLKYYSQAKLIDVRTIFANRKDKAEAVAELQRRIDSAHAQRVLVSSEVFYPAADKYSRCTEVQMCTEWAPAMRNEFLARSRIVYEGPLEEVRELKE